MSSKKTPKLSLHSWAPEDSFLRAEMNENFNKLDANVASTATAIAAKCEVITGTCTGNGSNQIVTLGRRPKAVIVHGPWSYNNGSDCGERTDFCIDGTNGHAVQIIDGGFSVNRTDNYPYMVASGSTYFYIAFL